MNADFAAHTLDLIQADRSRDHLKYLRTQRLIEHGGCEAIVIGQCIGIIRRLLDYSFDSDDEDADAFLACWINNMHEETPS